MDGRRVVTGDRFFSFFFFFLNHFTLPLSLFLSLLYRNIIDTRNVPPSFLLFFDIFLLEHILLQQQ